MQAGYGLDVYRALCNARNMSGARAQLSRPFVSVAGPTPDQVNSASCDGRKCSFGMVTI